MTTAPPTEIPQYVSRVLSRFHNVTWGDHDGFVAECPCHTHSNKGIDNVPSLRITVGTNGRILICCRAGCSAAAVLDAVDLRFRDLKCPTNEKKMDCLMAPQAEAVASLARSPEARHNHYFSMIRNADGGVKHTDAWREMVRQLKERGLSEEEIEFREYRVRRNGTFQGAQRWDVMIPVRDLEGNILAIKVRAYEPYISSHLKFPKNTTRASNSWANTWVNHTSQWGQTATSSGNQKPEGEPNFLKEPFQSQLPKDRRYYYFDKGCGAPVHVPLAKVLLWDHAVVRITEGELKADIATAYSGVLTLGCPGVSIWGGTIPILKAMGAKLVLLAFDWPSVLQGAARMQLARCILRLLDEGFVVKVETWDEPRAKGIDDLLTLGKQPTKVDAVTFLEFLGIQA